MHYLLTICFVLLNISCISQQTSDIEYNLKISKRDPFKVEVTVDFKQVPDTLYIHPSCPNYDYPEGWSTFITPLSKNLKRLENKTWIITKGSKISYEVDISFIMDEWEVGNEQAGTAIDGSVFIVTRSLFLFPNTPATSKVSFALPENHIISAPWKSTDGTHFFIENTDELINNTLVWGPHSSEEIQEGNFNLQFVLLGYDDTVKSLVSKTFQSVLSEYLKIFPNTPKTNYLITLFPYDQNDGEAYESSNAFTLKFAPTENNKLTWANLFAHELFHKWNGRMINGPNRSERQWFSEGFTEYYANLALVRSGVIDENKFYHLIEKTIGLYYYFRNRQFREVSLKKAGSKKSLYRFGVYNGGWCAAFVMDMMIRERLKDKSLDDFMSYLFTRFGLTGVDYELNDLSASYKILIGKENTFFEQFIIGPDELPVAEYFSQMGLLLDYTSYEATAFIIEDEKADKEKRELRNAWLSGK